MRRRMLVQQRPLCSAATRTRWNAPWTSPSGLPHVIHVLLRLFGILQTQLLRISWHDTTIGPRASHFARRRDRGTPKPPSPEDAARLLNYVWEWDEEFGLYLWSAMTMGARRGELLVPREDRFDFDQQEVTVGRNYLVRNGQHIEKDTNTGEWPRLSIDALICELFADHFARRRAAAAEVGVVVPLNVFAFSPDPTGSVPWNPDTHDAPAAVAIEDAKLLFGTGQARNRTAAAVERTVPFMITCQAPAVCWYATAGHHPADTKARRLDAPWYTSKTEPSTADMSAKLRRVIIAAKFKRLHADQPQPEEIHAIRLAWEDAGDLAA